MGGWLFRHRTIIPLPLALLLLLPAGRPALAGLALIAAGEALRLWAVRHIGTISRTRQDRLGPLVDTGPFALARNPLYIGNIMLWVGFALVAARPWLVALVLVARQLNRRADRWIAPAAPVAWWPCPACRSLNVARRETCYRCGRPLESGTAEMRTDAEPPAPQSFGRRFNGGPRKDGPG